MSSYLASAAPQAPPSARRRTFCVGLTATAGLAAVGLAGSGRAGAEASSGATWPGMRVIDERQTRFGRLYVVEVGRKRYLAYGPGARFVFQSGIDLDRPHELLASYTRVMMLGMVYAPTPERVVQIGVGAGNMAGYAIRTFPMSTVHAIDIDPEALDLGARHFGLAPHPRLRVHVEDGRRWLESTPGRFDVVMLDAYDNKGIPAALREAGFFTLVASRLAVGGVVVQNVFTEQVDAPRLIAAMRTAFAQVDVYRAERNRVLIGYAGPPRLPADLRARARELDARLRPAHSLDSLLDLRTVD